jgi:hypothetical protein
MMKLNDYILDKLRCVGMACAIVVILAYFLIDAVGETDRKEAAPVSGDSVIRAKAGTSEIVITTTSRVAGAIHSLTWNGMEFIDSADHGRQLQSASNFDNNTKYTDETFNPTEAGSSADGAGNKSSSKLLKLAAKNSILETSSQMAFWLKPGKKSLGNPAKNTTILSNHRLTKRVVIGYKDLPHAIEYTVTFNIPADEKHTFAQFEALTGYMPPAFDKFYTYDAGKDELAPLSDGPGEQSRPVVLATDTGSHAMGIYSPDQPSPGYESAGYGRWKFKNERVNKWNTVFRYRDKDGVKPGDYTFRCFVTVGTLADVKSTMRALMKEFAK